jgi:NAD(P)-dependent dehydrogenase (short-subunit alcohol dehydrogenase family)
LQRLENGVAVVTGGGSGIGRAIALEAARAGMHALVADVDEGAAKQVADEVRALGPRAAAAHCDVTDRASVERLAERAWSELGGCQLLCNNAGVLVMGALQERSDADWEWVLGVNLRGVIHGVQAFLPRMLAQDGESHVVNTASMAGHVAFPTLGVYTTSKYAVVGLSESLRADLARTRVGVSVLCPGGVQTRITESERNRPARLGTSRVTQSDREAVTQAANEQPEEMIDPAIVGQKVIRAVRAGEFWILTHPHWRGLVEQRYRDLMAAFDRQSS